MQHDSPLRNRHQAWLAAETDRIEAQVNSADRPGAATADRQGELALEYLPYGPGDESGAPSLGISGGVTPGDPIAGTASAHRRAPRLR